MAGTSVGTPSPEIEGWKTEWHILVSWQWEDTGHL
jgi:hypothetical protein